MSRVKIGLLAAIAAVAATSAEAGQVLFSGSSFNVNAPPAIDAGCAPLRKLSIGPDNATGASNLGSFTFTQTHCSTGGPGPYSGGAFQYMFEQGDMLSGSYSGVLTPGTTMGLLTNSITFVVTGGTGRFAGGTGTINALGTVDFRGALPEARLDLDGVLNLPAVPEPSSWAMLITGFGLTGSVLRRRRSIAAVTA